jgi:hypothetical protein
VVMPCCTTFCSSVTHEVNALLNESERVIDKLKCLSWRVGTMGLF